MREILLVEPGYKAKFPPLGLMKLATYHKRRGDHVFFVKGCIPAVRAQQWDRVYVSSLFTFYWGKTVEAIRYYQACVPQRSDVFVGGVLATLLRDDLAEETGATVIAGILDKPGVLDEGDRQRVDTLVPDYGILDDSDYEYGLRNSYIGYATRGCSRRCSFCAVHKVEPEFVGYIPLKRQVWQVDELFGPKRDLILLDNNVLASDDLGEIIKDIKALGFERGARFSYRNKGGQTSTIGRCVDFNQGLDLRLIDERKLGLLSEIAIQPIRIAFDHIALQGLYEKKIRLAARFDLRYLSNYILYNFNDHPDDFYHRLRINLDLNEELGLQIFSFPMRYVDLACKNRLSSTPGNIGQLWNPKYLRAIQCVLLRTRGLVGTRRAYFLKAFGENIDEYHKIMLMPESYIIHRQAHEEDGSTEKWWSQVSSLTGAEREVFMDIVCNHRFRTVDQTALSKSVRDALEHYMIRDDRKKRAQARKDDDEPVAVPDPPTDSVPTKGFVIGQE